MHCVNIVREANRNEELQKQLAGLALDSKPKTKTDLELMFYAAQPQAGETSEDAKKRFVSLFLSFNF
jgi:hypothetical protein